MSTFPFVIEYRSGRCEQWTPYLCFDIKSGGNRFEKPQFGDGGVVFYVVQTRDGRLVSMRTDAHDEVRRATMTPEQFLSSNPPVAHSQVDWISSSPGTNTAPATAPAPPASPSDHPPATGRPAQ